jgi:acetyltransferase-like isoleucine patch superfamily enzyme
VYAPADRAVGLTLGDGVELGEGVELAPHVTIGDGARIGAGSRIGAGTVLHAGTVVGEGAVIEEHAVLGKRPRLAAHSSAPRTELPPLVLGDRVTVCCGAVVFAGARVGDGCIVGDQGHVRERTELGARTVIGRGSSVDNDVVIGARVRVQTLVYLTAFTLVEDDVFVGPGASTTNDSTMGRHPQEEPLLGATLRRACRVGGSVVVTPGVEIGEEAFVAAGAVVTKDVPARGVAMGVPARVVRQVGEEDLLERWR